MGALERTESPAGQYPPLGPAPRVLMVWPAFPMSFWGFQDMIALMSESTLMPPLGLLTIAALCPKDWSIRLIDEAVNPVRDEDILGADLVMVSAMHAQRDGVHELLRRARRLGRRTMIGGPYASAEPHAFLPLADHVVAGEPDEIFGEIAREVQDGTAAHLYRVVEKPDLTRSPLPRYDLIDEKDYVTGALQFSRGCPFQCEFCDIITLYGRKPRAKHPAQVLAELDQLQRLGWDKPIFIVDDNFIGNHKLALELVRELALWQQRNGFPCNFFTEASMNLAERTELMSAMVEANFFFVFIGIESPSEASLREAKKFQNLRKNPLDSIRAIQAAGLWVTGGFIVGFDNDDEGVFELQRAFIEAAAIPWAMTGFLQAVPTTPLFDRMRAQGRLFLTQPTSNFSSPNFETKLPRSKLLAGQRELLGRLYSAEAFYESAWRSLLAWGRKPVQKRSMGRIIADLTVVTRSFWHQGILSSDRWHYWRFLARVWARWPTDPTRLWMGWLIAVSGNHFVRYARAAQAELDLESRKPAPTGHPASAYPVAEATP